MTRINHSSRVFCGFIFIFCSYSLTFCLFSSNTPIAFASVVVCSSEVNLPPRVPAAEAFSMIGITRSILGRLDSRVGTSYCKCSITRNREDLLLFVRSFYFSSDVIKYSFCSLIQASITQHDYGHNLCLVTD